MARKPNPFWTFAKFYRDTRRDDGFHLSMDQSCREASGIWTQMGDHEKELFEQTAEESRVAKLNFDRALALNLPRRKPRGLERRYIKSVKSKHFKYLEKVECLEKHIFPIAFVKATQSTGALCEITVVRFNLTDGVQTYFHVVLNPEISGDQYTEFRQVFGDLEPVVRVKDTTNSIANRRAIRDALLDFCGGSEILVLSSNVDDAVNGLRFIDPDAAQSPFEVLDAQEILIELSQRIQNFKLTKGWLADQVKRDLKNDSAALRCALHQKLVDFDCSLSNCLRATYALMRPFLKEFEVEKKPGKHFFSPETRPRGVHYEGLGKSEEDVGVNESWDW